MNLDHDLDVADGLVGVFVPEDVRADPQHPAVVCRHCGGALGGLTLTGDGSFEHADPTSCRLGTLTPPARARSGRTPLTTGETNP